MLKRLPRRVLAVALVMSLGLGVAACGNSTKEGSGSTTEPVSVPTDGGDANRDKFVEINDVPGVTDEEIGYAVVGTKTGNPLGTCILDCYTDGINAYFAYRNSEGGIYGRDLVVSETIDDELVQNQQKSLDIIAADDVFGVFQATLLASGWAALNDAGIPVYAWGINSVEAANQPNIFPSLVIRCADCTHPSIPWLADHQGGTTAAAIGYGNSENSKDCTQANAASFEEFEKDSGVKLVYTNDDLQFGLANGLGPEVSAMKELGVDVIATCVDINGAKALVSELHRQDMDDVIIIHPNSYDPSILSDPELVQDDVVGVQFRPFEANAEGNGLTEYQKWIKEVGGEANELSMTGWINASLAYEGLLAAGPEFDREKVIAATNAMTAFSADGVIEPIDWTVSHEPYTQADGIYLERNCGAFVVIDDGEFAPISNPDKPWLCWTEGDDYQYEPTETNFE